MTEPEALTLHATAQELQLSGQHAEALPLLISTAAYFESADGPHSPDLANVLSDVTESLLALCRYQEAEQQASRAKEILLHISPLLSADSRRTLLPRALMLWGRSLRELGRYPEAAIPLRQAIEEDPSSALYLNEYGILCKYWGRFEEGEQHYRRALELLEGEPDIDRSQIATIYHNLGGLEHSRRDFARGEPLARKAYEIRRKAVGESHPDTIADKVAWGGLLDGLNRYSESIPIYESALAYYEETLGPQHFEVAATLNNLGMAKAAQGNTEEARRHIKRSLAIKQHLFAPGHPEIELTEANLSAL